MAGLTEYGLTIKTLEEIQEEITSRLIARLDADLNVEADSVAGNIAGIVAGMLLDCWELLGQIYDARNPDSATGQSLSYLASLTGTIRQPATAATADIQCTFSGTPTFTAGTAIYVDGDPDSRFELLADYTTTSSPEKITFTASTPGSYSTIATTDDLVVENEPLITAATLALTEDFTKGTDAETDEELRYRRLTELARPGTGTVAAIEADIWDAKTTLGIEYVTVFENPTGTTDSRGIPPHAIEVLVRTGAGFDADALGQKIWDVKPAGIYSHGTTAVTTVEDSTQTTRYTTPTEVPIHIAFSIGVDTPTYVGADAVKAAIVAWGDTVEVGQSIYASDIIDVIMALDGIDYVDASTVKVEDTDPPTTQDQAITDYELATFATGNIDVTVL